MTKRTSVTVIVAGICLAVVAARIGTCAQSEATEKTYVAEFNSYQNAVSNGDSDAAERYGYAAWQAAEAELGDHKLTAVLAYNYGQLVLFGDSEIALAALRRADRLQRAGVAELPTDLLRIYVAYVEFVVEEGRRKQSEELYEALVTNVAQEAQPNVDLAVMWLHLAEADVRKKRYQNALKSSEIAEAAIQAAAPDDYRTRARAILLNGIARIVPYPRDVEVVTRAHNDFVRGQRLFPPQKDFQNFDQTFAQLIGWSAAADAAIRNLGEDHSILESGGSKAPAGQGRYFESEIGRPSDCGIQWDKREAPRFPVEGLNRGYLGAVILVLDFGDLKPTKIHILSEVPAGIFGDIAVKTASQWTLMQEPFDHPGCRTNLISQFTFVIEE